MENAEVAETVRPAGRGKGAPQGQRRQQVCESGRDARVGVGPSPLDVGAEQT